MTPTETTPVASQTRVTNLVLWTVQILLAALFVFAAAGKLLGEHTAVEMFDEIGFGQWFRYVTGACELAGGIGLLIPRLAGLASIGLVGVMIGATLTNLFLIDGTAPLALVTVALGVVFGVIAWLRRNEIVALWKLVMR